MRVLIIDDDPAIRCSFARVVTGAGWQAFTCDQDADCAQLIREHGIHVLLSDYRMPPTTGLEIIARLRAAKINTPAVLVSAEARGIDPRHAARLGVTKILLKPPDLGDLRKALADAVAASG